MGKEQSLFYTCRVMKQESVGEWHYWREFCRGGKVAPQYGTRDPPLFLFLRALFPLFNTLLPLWFRKWTAVCVQSAVTQSCLSAAMWLNTLLKGASRCFYIDLPIFFLHKMIIPCLARREVLQKLNIVIDQETAAVAELRMPRNTIGPIDTTDDVPVYRVIITNEKDRTYLGCSTWTSFAQEKGFRVHFSARASLQ